MEAVFIFCGTTFGSIVLIKAKVCAHNLRPHPFDCRRLSFLERVTHLLLSRGRVLIQQLIVTSFSDLKIASIFKDLLLLGGQLLSCHVVSFGLRELFDILLLALVDLLDGDVARLVVA